jgi:glycosyltransferase involved in cell wall biosynthesis
MKIALVHDWLITYSGSERVVEQILQAFPDADLFCLFDGMPEAERSFLRGKKVRTSFLQKFPFKNSLYRSFLPLMPIAVEQLDLSAYDVVISNCHATSKGVITSPDQLHLSYIHTPIRYAWDMQNEYLEAYQPGWLTNIVVRSLLHYIRLWDISASNRPDVILANSVFIARRIRKIYRRESQVLYPPVDVNIFSLQENKADYYLTASRLVPYKRMDLIMEAFRGMPDKKLVVIGDGPERAKIRNLAMANVQWLGYQSTEALRNHMQNARAFIFAARDDFGIMPLEAQACGTPVIAFQAGGVAETIRGLDHPRPTGIFFLEQTSRAVQAAVTLFESVSDRLKPQACRQNAERFSNLRFRQEFSEHLHKAWAEFQERKGQAAD